MRMGCFVMIPMTAEEAAERGLVIVQGAVGSAARRPADLPGGAGGSAAQTPAGGSATQTPTDLPGGGSGSSAIPPAASSTQVDSDPCCSSPFVLLNPAARNSAVRSG
jgi:hypothetical protein